MLRKRRRKAALGSEQAGDPAAALAAAVALLSRRDFCCGELRQQLAAQGFEARALEQALADLRERHYLDDERYAGQFVAYHAERGQGPLRIERDLAELGVAAELIEAALAGHGDWARLAREVRIRRFGLALPSSWPEKARQARFLQYRGFSIDHVRSALGPDAIP
jgi:regulatory protein